MDYDLKIRNDRGEVVRTSRNLRGIMDHARRFQHEPCRTSLRAIGGRRKRTLFVEFPNGDSCFVGFASEQVLREWIAARVRYGRGKFEEYVT